MVYTPPGFLDSEDELGNIRPGKWRNMVDDSVIIANSTLASSVRALTLQAREVREILKEHFFSEDAINFQWTMTE